MYKIYFKQAIAMLKQNKFISIITITGTALAIMMIMVIIVTESIKNISIAPEINRDKTMYVKNFVRNKKDPNSDYIWCGTLPYEYYKKYLSELKTPKNISAVENMWSGDKFMVKKDNTNERFLARTKMVDASYWEIMSFSFISGRPFTQEEFESGLTTAIITDQLAKKVFGNADPLGKGIEIDFKDYKVIGVVKAVPQTFQYGYGEMYIPYTSKGGYENRTYHVLSLLNDNRYQQALIDEYRAAERKFNAEDDEWNLKIQGPYTHRIAQLARYSNEDPDVGKANKRMIMIFLILLLIPAINLSSFSMSRIKRRTEEIGIRKAFGAKKYVILMQVMYENFITSLIGGIIGLILSYIIVVWLKSWLLGISSDGNIPVGALISIPVFLGVFTACFLLNILSAGFPAYRASKMKIVDSLNNKTA